MSVHGFFALELCAAALTGEDVDLVHHGVHVGRDALAVHYLRLPAAARRQLRCTGDLQFMAIK